MPKPEGDERVGHCAVGDVTYLSGEQPLIHNDERLDLEEYDPTINEYEEEAA
jgi:hypothetical protein